MSGATAAGLLQRNTGRHSITPCSVLAVSDERGRAARLVFSSSKCDNITPHLRQLHWLTISWRIDFHLAVLVYKCLHGLAPSYLADELHHPAESEFRRRLRSASSHVLSVSTVSSTQPTATELFQSLPFGSGTVFRTTSHPRRHFPSSALARRHILLRTVSLGKTFVVPAK